MPKIAEFLLGFHGPTPYVLVFLILLACGFGVPIPEDITLIAAGILAYYETVNIWTVIAVGLAGVMLGDSAMFWLGRRYGLTLAKRPIVARIMPAERLARVADVLATKGNKILFAARFMPGLRSPLFFTAGALGVSARTFLFYDGLAALISVPAIVYSVYFFGHRMDEIITAIQQTNRGIVVILVIVATVLFVKWHRSRHFQPAVQPSEKINREVDAA
jgi:membrane protein DedA with SNARE-associated domain